MTERQLVELRLDEHEVAWVRLTNPAQRNVLTTELSWQLARLVEDRSRRGQGLWCSSPTRLSSVQGVRSMACSSRRTA